MDKNNPWHIMDNAPSAHNRTPGILNKKEDGSFEYQIINEWQLCPKCAGTGIIQGHVTMMRLGPIAGDITCDLCNGTKIISKVNGLPPNNQSI